MRRILIDSGILLSYYQQQEPLHMQEAVGSPPISQTIMTSRRWSW